MVQGKRHGNLGAQAQVRQHTLLIDVSEGLGGADLGPTPHELIEAALTACTIITVQMYANRKGLVLRSTNVSVKIVSEGKEGTHLLREISFDGDLDDEQRAKLLEIADKCPIHALLTREVTIETQHVGS